MQHPLSLCHMTGRALYLGSVFSQGMSALQPLQSDGEKQHAETRNGIGKHSQVNAAVLGDDADEPWHENGSAAGHRKHHSHTGDAGHPTGAGHRSGIHTGHGEGKGKEQNHCGNLGIDHHQTSIKNDASNPHFNHGRGGIFDGEHKSNQQTRNQSSAPHDSHRVGAEQAGQNTASFKVGNHPSGDTGFSGILAEEKPCQNPKFTAFQE